MSRQLIILSVLAVGCEPHTHDHPHLQGRDHADAEPPTLSITRWTDDYELFVELPAPVPGSSIPYHAHVTRLSDFSAVTEGTFRARFRTSATVAVEAAQVGVKRPGIFVFESPAPAAGMYTLEMTYEHEGKTATFDCGSIVVGAAPEPEEEPTAATITFLKESQWKVPFATGWAAPQRLAKELEIPATIEPAGIDTLTVGAPTTGRFFHSAKLAIAEGARVKKGETLGTIAPTTQGEDFSRLELAVEESKLVKSQLEREIERVGPLVEQGLLPQKRLVDLRNELESHTTRLRSAGARLEGVLSPGRDGTLTVRSSLAGVVSEVFVGNGQPVEAGAPLVRIGGTDHLWVRARFVAKPASMLLGARPSNLRLPSGEVIELAKLDARLLSSLPVVDPVSRIATWIVEVSGPKPGSQQGETSANLRPGSSAVLSLRIGEPKELLAVPKGAVVEINTRPFVFVQVDGEHFEKRPVTLGQSDGPWVHLSTGIESGERVVTRGGFDIHLASLMGTVESHRH